MVDFQVADRGNLLGVVLAGGRSRRMGQNKALMRFVGSTTLFEYVLRRFQMQISAIVISTPVIATPDIHRFFKASGCALVEDIADFGGRGPLAGIHSVFDYCHRHDGGTYSGIITVAVDTPFFPENYIARMGAAAAGQPEKQAFMATVGEKCHPTFTFWSLSLAPALHEHLETGERSVMSFFEKANGALVEFPVSSQNVSIQNAWQNNWTDPFFNINTPREFELARHRLNAGNQKRQRT